MTQTPGEKIAGLTGAVSDIRDDLFELKAEIREARSEHQRIWNEIHSLKAFKNWVVGVAMGLGAIGTLLIKRIGEVLGI